MIDASAQIEQSPADVVGLLSSDVVTLVGSGIYDPTGKARADMMIELSGQLWHARQPRNSRCQV